MKVTNLISSATVRMLTFTTCVCAASLVFYSFTVNSLRDDFLRQLGITKPEAQERMKNSVIGGSIDTYGLNNAKKIPLLSRAAVTKDILSATRSYLESAAFKKEYETMKEQYRPATAIPETPDELREKNSMMLKKSLAESEAALKKADATMKPVYEKVVAEGKKQLAEIQNPDNKQMARYTKNYPQLVKDSEARNKQLLNDWEKKYPADHLQFVKRRLQEFLQVTSDVDFNAQLINRNGVKIFADPQYERRDYRWKMAFRAGREVVEPAREFVQQWLKQIENR